MGAPIGVLKTAAKRIGLPFDVYMEKIGSGLRWCYACKDFHPQSCFGKEQNRSRGIAPICKEKRNARATAKRALIPPEFRKPGGPPSDIPRDGDKNQARRRVNLLVRTGRLPHPGTLPCTDCGHRMHEGCKLRHEYDHYKGYGAAYHTDAEVVCWSCHHLREGRRYACAATRAS
jgi:hypothetical protein